MRYLYASFGMAALLAFPARAQNSCGSPLPVVAGTTYTVDAINGTPSAFICSPNTGTATRGEWYIYTPPQDTTVTVSTDLPQNAGGDTRFQVFSGACGNLTCVGGDDDSGDGLLSVTSFDAQLGVNYYIVFDDHWSSAGFDFILTESPPIPGALEFTQVQFTGASYWDCVVDMNGDHLDDVVHADANVINVHYQQPGGGFNYAAINTPFADNTPSWSICAGDLDHNGYTDLMYGGGGGASFMIANDDGTAYTEVSFAQFIFCQRTNMVDLNNDGHLDAFSCHDVAANVWFLNDGSNNLTYNQGGMGETCGNYGSVFIDIDNDLDMDLFVSKCGCDPVDILYRNNGDGTFTNVAGPMGFADSQQSWSSAWGDFDNDGDMDVLVGSSGGDGHKLMRNDGDVFTNVTAGSGFDSYSGSSIEWTAHDFNNDGWMDVLGGGAYFSNNGDMTFNPHIIPAYNGAVGDLNNDGFLDIVNAATGFLNQPNGNHYLTVNTVGTVSNSSGIGARVELYSPMGTQVRDVKSGDGFRYMSSLNTHFGLGADMEIYSVVVRWPSGIVNEVLAPAIDTVLTIVEEVNTAVSDTKPASELQLFPNPTDAQLSIVLPQGINVRAAQVYDVAGKLVLSPRVVNNRTDVSALPAGTYVLDVQAGDRRWRERFTRR